MTCWIIRDVKVDATDIATGETFNRLAERKRHAANDLLLQETAHG